MTSPDGLISEIKCVERSWQHCSLIGR